MIRVLLCLALVLSGQSLAAQERQITLASTTSTQNSGLFDVILPLFEAASGIKVNVVAVGTGQALRIARNGDADALLVHHRPSEEAFVAEGWGIERHDVMYNDFVLVGPEADPVGIADATSAADALTRIAGAEAIFTSRGDESGTHLKERELWVDAGITPAGDWYRETGSGMGSTLNIAVAMQAYVMTDRGTWITFGNKGDLDLLFYGDPALFNPYGVILVNPERHPHVKVELAREFAEWLISSEGQDAIGGFRIAGQQAFCPGADFVNGAGQMVNPHCPAKRPAAP